MVKSCAPRQSGAVAWGLGLLAIVPFPFVSAVAASVTMAAVGRAQRKNGPVAAANGRNAANWGLTYLALSVPLIVVHFVVQTLFTRVCHRPTSTRSASRSRSGVWSVWRS